MRQSALAAWTLGTISRPGLGYLVIFVLYMVLFLLSSLALTRVKIRE